MNSKRKEDLTSQLEKHKAKNKALIEQLNDKGVDDVLFYLKVMRSLQ